MLGGKRILVTGVATRESIGFHIAREAQLAGAEVILTSFGRVRSLTVRAARQLPVEPEVLELDLTSESDLAAIESQVRERWDGLDGLVHAVAYAAPDAVGGSFLETSSASAAEAFDVSAFSLKSLARALLPLLHGDGRPGASVVGLDFDASVAWPMYNWMGVAKAGLEAVARYLARDLGPLGVRVNLVAAGPIHTLAANSLPGFGELIAAWGRQAPLGWDTRDPTPVARAACFLLSDWASMTSGEMIHVDGGYHAMGTDIRGSRIGG